mgnify:CR=1 FL=1
MPAMPPSKPIQLRLSDEIDAALRAHCEDHGLELSAFIRDTLCRAIKRRDLVGTMRGRGKPKKAE